MPKSRNGEPYQIRVRRAETALLKGKLITKERSGWHVTERGRQELARLQKAPVSDRA